MAGDNTIAISLSPNSSRIECIAEQTYIFPGMLVIVNSSGNLERDGVINSTSTRIIALEDIFSGRTITNFYRAGERMYAVYCRPGDVVLSWLAAGQSVAIGDLLWSNGDGTLKKYGTTAGDEPNVGTALEAKPSTGSTVRIRVSIF